MLRKDDNDIVTNECNALPEKKEKLKMYDLRPFIENVKKIVERHYWGNAGKYAFTACCFNIFGIFRFALV